MQCLGSAILGVLDLLRTTENRFLLMIFVSVQINFVRKSIHVRACKYFFNVYAALFLYFFVHLLSFFYSILYPSYYSVHFHVPYSRILFLNLHVMFFFSIGFIIFPHFLGEFLIQSLPKVNTCNNGKQNKDTTDVSTECLFQR